MTRARVVAPLLAATVSVLLAGVVPAPPASLPSAVALPAPQEPRVALSSSLNPSVTNVRALQDAPARDATELRTLHDARYTLEYEQEDIDLDGHVSYPAYSPDGSRMVFSVQPGRLADDWPELVEEQMLMVADVAGAWDDDPGTLSNVEPLDYDHVAHAIDTHAVWSPTGEHIAFVRWQAGDGLIYPYWPQVHVLDLRSGETTLMVPVPAGRDGGPEDFASASPSWTPDGAGLIMRGAAQGSFEEGLEGLWYYPLTGEPQRIRGEAEMGTAAVGWSPEGDLATADIALAPDGETLAFTTALAGQPRGLHALRLPSPLPPTGDIVVTEEAWLVRDTWEVPAATWVGEPGNLTWSPDGSEIGATIAWAQGSAVFAVNAQSGQPRDIYRQTSGSNSYGGMSFQPWSDITVAGEVPFGAVVSHPHRIDISIANEGPSPSREIALHVRLDHGSTVGALPAPCEQQTADIRCVFDGLAVGDTVELSIPLVHSVPGNNGILLDVATQSTEAPQAQANNSVAIFFLVEDDPGWVPAQDDRRISFDMYRARSVPGQRTQSFDLADTLSSGIDDYRVLLGQEYENGTDILLPDEEGISYSPDGSQAVFAVQPPESRVEDILDGHDRRLMVADVVGTMETALGEPGELRNIRPLDVGWQQGYRDSEPAWSPDGTRIAFNRGMETSDDALRSIDVYVHDLADGSVQLAATTVHVPDGVEEPWALTTPSWSPDSDALIVIGGYPEGTAIYDGQVWHIQLSDGSLRPLVLPADGSVCMPFTSVCEGPMWGASADWSPDGSRLVVQEWQWTRELALVGLPPDLSNLAVTLPADAGLELTSYDAFFAPATAEPGAVSQVVDPAWSPDGTEIAVGGWDYAERTFLGAIDATTGELRRILEPQANSEIRYPEFFPWSDLEVSIAADAPWTAGEEGTLTVTARNTGPSPARDAHLDVRLPPGATPGVVPPECALTGDLLSCTTDTTMWVGEEIAISVPLTFAAVGDHEVSASVTTNSVDPDEANNEAQTTVRVDPPATVPTDPPGVDPSEPPPVQADLAVTLDLDVDEAWVGGDLAQAQIEVRNEGPSAAEAVRLVLDLPAEVEALPHAQCGPAGECVLGDLAPGAATALLIQLTPLEPGEATLTAEADSATADPNTANNSAAATLEVLQAELRLLPSVAVPGEVTLLYGSDLPPGTEVEVRWSAGVTSNPGPYIVAPNGTLRVPMLVVADDTLGQRTVRLDHVAGRHPGLVEPPSMLVVPGSYTRADFLNRS